MDEVTLVKNRFRKEQWQQLILECQGSTLTVKDWCAGAGITHHAYYYWLRKLRLEACSSLPVPIEEPEKTIAFKKLEVQSPVPNIQAAVMIHLPSATIEVHNGVNQQTVEAVLLALKKYMLGDISIAEEIYIACGYTYMRKSIDGLAAIVQEQFQLNPFTRTLYLFCGKRSDRLKALLWEGDGFVLLYKRLENGNFKWPRCESEVNPISCQQFRWLMEGLEMEQKTAILPAKPGSFC